MRIVFQGDSITEGGRDKTNPHHLGKGYPKYVSEILVEKFPKIDFEFVNQGIASNRTDHLLARLSSDAIAFEPDIITLLIGINDVWHETDGSCDLTDEQTEINYRAILTQLREQTNAKIVMVSPYLLDAERTNHVKGDLARLIATVRKLADEFADAFMPLDQIFDEAIKNQPEPLYYSADGVHPNPNGAELIGRHLAEILSEIIAK